MRPVSRAVIPCSVWFDRFITEQIQTNSHPPCTDNTKITNKSFLQWNNESSIQWFYIFFNTRTTQLAKYTRLFLDLKKSI